MRTLIISCVLAVAPACSLFQSQESSQLTALPDAGTVNDACHGGGDGGCCSQGGPDGGPQYWPDGGIEDAGGYLPDGGWVPDAWPAVDGGSWSPDAGSWSSDGGSWVPDAGP